MSSLSGWPGQLATCAPTFAPFCQQWPDKINPSLDLAIEATISLQVWTTNAPDLAATDRQYIASETRAAEAVFHDLGDAPAEAEGFEVDGATVHVLVVEA